MGASRRAEDARRRANLVRSLSQRRDHERSTRRRRVANTATNEGQGAKRVGRLVSRALLVFGGAVAGTAAAWLVSGAAASADTVEVGTAPVTEAADGSL